MLVSLAIGLKSIFDRPINWHEEQKFILKLWNFFSFAINGYNRYDYDRYNFENAIKRRYISIFLVFIIIEISFNLL